VKVVLVWSVHRLTRSWPIGQFETSRKGVTDLLLAGHRHSPMGNRQGNSLNKSAEAAAFCDRSSKLIVVRVAIHESELGNRRPSNW